MTAKGDFIFRRALQEDIGVVREMIQELADFENMSEGPKLTVEDLIKDAGLTGEKDYAHIYVLQLKTNDNPIAATIGYTICFFSYSTWQGKSYFLEDIYVRPAFRGIGAGAHIFRQVAAKAKEYGCRRVDFHVLAWNPARKFYEKMGATDLTKTEEWHFYRLQEEQIEKLATELEEKRSEGN